MIEGLLLIIFFIVGSLVSLLVLFFLAFAMIRRSKPMFYSALLLSLIPITLYALTSWFYDLYLPKQYKKEQNDYVGVYVLKDSSIGEAKQLHLYQNDIFEIDEIVGIPFSGKGIWKAGETDDGQFTFYNGRSIVFWAWPNNKNRIEIEGDAKNYKFLRSQ